MTAALFAPGDQVVLKTGGPVMTVVSHDAEGDPIAVYVNERTGEIIRVAIEMCALTRFGEGARDGELAGHALPAARAALDAAGLRAPFRVDADGAVRDAAGAHVCDAMPDRPGADAKALAAARAIANALNAIMETTQ